MFAFDETKNMSLVNANTCTRKYMNVLIACKITAVSIKIEKMKQTNIHGYIHTAAYVCRYPYMDISVDISMY